MCTPHPHLLHHGMLLGVPSSSPNLSSCGLPQFHWQCPQGQGQAAGGRQAGDTSSSSRNAVKAVTLGPGLASHSLTPRTGCGLQAASWTALTCLTPLLECLAAASIVRCFWWLCVVSQRAEMCYQSSTYTCRREYGSSKSVCKLLHMPSVGFQMGVGTLPAQQWVLPLPRSSGPRYEFYSKN